MAQAGELRIVSGGPMESTFGEILPAYEAASKTRLIVRYQAMGPLLKELESGAAADVVVLSAEAMATARAKRFVDDASMTEIGRVGVGVGVKQGAPVPDISTSQAFKSALLAAKTVAATDPTKGTSGMHFAEVLARLGIAEQMKPKLRLVDGGTGAELVARGEAELVVQPITVIIPVKGVTFAGPLPGELQKISLYIGAVTKASKEAAAAKALLAHLQAPAARAAFVERGFEK